MICHCFLVIGVKGGFSWRGGLDAVRYCFRWFIAPPQLRTPPGRGPTSQEAPHHAYDKRGVGSGWGEGREKEWIWREKLEEGRKGREDSESRDEGVTRWRGSQLRLSGKTIWYTEYKYDGFVNLSMELYERSMIGPMMYCLLPREKVE